MRRTTMPTFEARLLRELKLRYGHHIRRGDIRDWDSKPINPKKGEVVEYLPGVQVYVAYADIPEPRTRR
jgi:hypothetical protein